ncbi:hypothetical protein [Clostridium estertheticum]|uniref:hypothetical protein n=1 Tax=Clostridium estertheticum TaxID=238834 RepID=UPI0014795AD4|nr:hypothetical protein [Clostridium estertheticum]MBZ9616502.1 hypothetical protein [Clostridium estertheticum subsp. laramiense]
MKALLTGSIANTKQLIQCRPNSMFIAAEDCITLIRLFSNDSGKKVVVLNNYVHVRRINGDTLSKTINEKN